MCHLHSMKELAAPGFRHGLPGEAAHRPGLAASGSMTEIQAGPAQICFDAERYGGVQGIYLHRAVFSSCPGLLAGAFLFGHGGHLLHLLGIVGLIQKPFEVGPHPDRCPCGKALTFRKPPLLDPPPKSAFSDAEKRGGGLCPHGSLAVHCDVLHKRKPPASLCSYARGYGGR